MRISSTAAFALAAVLTLPMAGCVLHIGDGAKWQDTDQISAQAVRNTNMERLSTLQIGMTTDQVQDVMGSSSSWLGDDIGWVASPYRTEAFQDENGDTVMIHYYYTHLRQRDNVISDDELTPVLFRNGKLAGWGSAITSGQIRRM